MKSNIIIWILGIAVVILGAIVLSQNISFPKVGPEPIACTMEAKMCPDGSAVGRSGPRCEFAACPDEKPTTQPAPKNTGISGNVLLGPMCPVMQIPPDPQCNDRSYETRLAVTTSDGAHVIKEFNSDAHGNFTVNLAPGAYTIRTAAAANILPYCASNDTIYVSTGTFTSTTVYCDTGIR